MMAGLRLTLLPFSLTLALAGAAGATGQGVGATWQTLTPGQKQILAPLERDWGAIDAQRRAKWLEVAAQFPSMPEAEKQRLQARMADWARMTPAQRSSARLQFQEARRLPPDERQARWLAYQALSEDDRHALAQKAKPPAKVAGASTGGQAKAPADSDADRGKQNLVPSSASQQVRATSPTAQQARPGATTTSMTTRAAPPAHHQPGMPKIAATPGFVDSSTLLPKRGPQGAAVRSAAAPSTPSTDP
jgi:hypothetical protein